MTPPFDFNAPSNFDEEDNYPEQGENVTGHPSTEARMCAIQAVFQTLIVPKTFADVEAEFLSHEITPRKADKRLFKELVADVGANQKRYEELIKANLTDNWNYERVGSVEKAILLLGVGELFSRPKTPMKVILNEYISLAHAFLSQDGVGFINGVLNTAAMRIRPQEHHETQS